MRAGSSFSASRDQMITDRTAAFIPYSPGQGDTAPSDQANSEPAPVMAETERIPRVLVVDDEPNIRELVQVALKFHGCAVSTAANGTEAIRQAEATLPDLIVLDVMLPTSTASRSAAG